MTRLLIILFVVASLSALVRIFVPASFYTATALIIVAGAVVFLSTRGRRRRGPSRRAHGDMER
ncbi:hypothetical protein [Limimaricola sp.]|uniref:hypothetical protein n=1 Tax=Limimaricola sp. TaxID=2211665 RepID=UPI004059B877